MTKTDQAINLAKSFINDKKYYEEIKLVKEALGLNLQETNQFWAGAVWSMAMWITLYGREMPQELREQFMTFHYAFAYCLLEGIEA